MSATEIERVESAIRAGVVKARAAGSRITRGVWGIRFDGNGTIRLEGGCCLLAPLLEGKNVIGFDEPSDSELVIDEDQAIDEDHAAAVALDIDEPLVWAIVNGFDREPKTDRDDSDYYALGARLGREFVDGKEGVNG